MIEVSIEKKNPFQAKFDGKTLQGFSIQRMIIIIRQQVFFSRKHSENKKKSTAKTWQWENSVLA